ARMASGGDVELVAVPRTDDVARLGKAQTRAFLVRRQHLLDLIENLALTYRPAGVRTHVLVGNDLVAGPEYADFDFFEREYTIIAVGDVGELGDCDFFHRTSLHPRSGYSIPGGR